MACVRRVCASELKRFMVSAFQLVGVPPRNSDPMADVLLFAEKRGHPSHGIQRLDMYLRDIERKLIDPCADPCIVKESAVTALVNGNNGLGARTGLFSMDLAVSKACCNGIGMVVAKESNHFGMASYYAQRALQMGVIGIVCSNSSPLMAPTRSKCAGLGTNPWSFVAPGVNDCFILDMATTTAAVGKLELKKRDGQKIPLGWAQDTEGKPTTNAEEGIKAGCLMPLGGTEENAGYKGYGLGLMIEILCAGLTGGDYGPFIRKWTASPDKEADLSHCFIAINPESFEPGFAPRLNCILGTMRDLPPVDPKSTVLVAGDKERQHDYCTGDVINVPDNVFQELLEIAKRLSLRPPQEMK